MRQLPDIDDDSGDQPRTRVRAVARYTAGWLVVAIAVVAGALLTVGDREEEVGLPPLRETELTEAARAAECEFRTSGGVLVLRPDVSGPPAAAARPDVYTRAPEPTTLVGALRRGIVVIHYRPSLSEEQIDRLARLQQAVPAGTIVTPNRAMPFAVAVTAWRRLLACRDFEDSTMDAIRLFRGRYIGSGPDA